MRAAALWACLAIVACAGSRARTSPPLTAATRSRGLDYTFGLDAAFQLLSVRLCFEGDAPMTLVSGAPRSADLLRDPRVVREHGKLISRPLRRDGVRISLAGLAANSCIAYSVDVRAALENDSLMLAYPGEHSLLVGSELFLWRPSRRPNDLRVRARFELPEGIAVSTPWREHDHDYELDESAFAFSGHLVFGQFGRFELPVIGGVLDVITMEGFEKRTLSAIAPWLASAAQMVSQPGGAFPIAHLQVIVVPTSPSIFPIHFGHTGRSGGGSIVLFTPTDMDADQFRADWIAVHEFSHLLHPFVQRGDAWLSEGLATYLQEVLRVRAGALPEADAWRRLFEGAKLGRDADDGLAEETRRMAHAGNYQRVYWAGAAIALMADVEMRRRSEGRVSLDRVLAALTRDRVGAMRGVSADELVRAIDERAGMDVFQEIAARYLSAPNARLPDLSALYRELGLLDDGDALAPPHAAPLAWVRAAIMAQSG
ncbi:MAG TPA: hypothetical protein VGI70_10695 [Polyangiales bacterium]|jgi:hypothetical protein